MDLVELEKIAFNVILGKYWFHASYASIGCRMGI